MEGAIEQVWTRWGIRLGLGAGRTFCRFSVCSLFLLLHCFSAFGVPRTLNVTVRVSVPGKDYAISKGTLQLFPNKAVPFRSYGLLQVSGPHAPIRIGAEQVSLLLSHRFHQAVGVNAKGEQRTGFFIPTALRPLRTLFASRRINESTPGIVVDLSAKRNVTSIGIWLRPGPFGYSPTQFEEFWLLTDLENESIWQQLWVFTSAYWKDLSDLIEDQNTHMYRMPAVLNVLASKLEHPVSLDDSYFAVEAAKLLGIDEVKVCELMDIPAGSAPGPAHWAVALRHYASQPRGSKRLSPPAEYLALTSKLGKQLVSIPERSERLRFLGKILSSNRGEQSITPQMQALARAFLGSTRRFSLGSGATDAEYAQWALQESENALISEMKVELSGQLQLKTRRDKLEIISREIAEPISFQRQMAAVEIAKDMLGGEERARELAHLTTTELKPGDYQVALAEELQQTPDEDLEPLPSKNLKLEGRMFLGDWPEPSIPVEVEVAVNGKMRKLEGKLVFRGDEQFPFGPTESFKKNFHLEFTKGDGTTGFRPIERADLIPELWVFNLPPDNKQVLWRQKNGTLTPATFEKILFRDSSEGTRSFFYVKANIEGNASLHKVDPEDVFPVACEKMLLRGAKL